MTAKRAQDSFREQAGEAWTRLNQRTDAQLEAYGLAALSALAPAPGESVLDVGCGCGQTLLALAERVGPSGRVTGLDISEPMLGLARARCAALAQIEILLGDAAEYPLPAHGYDALFSRFGVMFFPEPSAAFRHLRGALRPGGRLAFVCWQRLELNPWAAVPLAAARRALPGAGLPAMLDPEQPGPFFFADPGRIEQILSGAGFSGTRIESFVIQSAVGGAGTLAEAVDYLCQIGPTARLLAEAGNEHDATVRAALGEALAAYVTKDGVVLDGAAFVVTAQNR